MSIDRELTSLWRQHCYFGCGFHGGRLEMLVVHRFTARVQQTARSLREVVENSLGISSGWAILKRSHMGHALIGRVADDLTVLFELFHTEQPVVIGRLLAWRDTEPGVIRIERF